MNHLSLFSGIGGIDLAAEWAGFETIAFCEIDPYCQKVLNKHWPNVPIIGDIRDVTKERIEEIITDSQGSGQLREEKLEDNQDCERDIQPITLLTGGFPCQPFSQAGKRKGNRDDRYLWPEMLRVIREVKPAWVIGENVGGITNLEVGDSVSDLEGEVPEEVFEHNSVVLDRVCADLEEISYSVQPFLIPACAINAPHRRDRVFIVANSTSIRRPAGGNRIPARTNPTEGQYYTENQQDWQEQRVGSSKASEADVTDPTSLRDESLHQPTTWYTESDNAKPDSKSREPNWWAIEPDVGRVANGVSSRVDRLKCLGNAVVPQQIYPILQAIAEIEGHRRLSYVTK